MNDALKYDCAIIGGGLAGLALSIQLANEGFKVILFEKEHYPFHKVCGEYLSLESTHFLQGLNVPLHEWDLPVMKRLLLTAPSGRPLTAALAMGGLGVSRYKLDAALAVIARRSGVEVWEGSRVRDVQFLSSSFHIQTNSGSYAASVCFGAFGKPSNLDVKWQREFIRSPGRADNYIGIKYHVRMELPKDLISLHSFKEGYCGVSAIEDNKYCLCYMTTASNLHDSQNDIRQMEESILYQNPCLKELFQSAEFLFEEPLVISQISLHKKRQVENHVLMVGDAAGMIAPLCGNGMSMALHGSVIAAEHIKEFLRGKMDRGDMESGYAKQWSKLFGRRLLTGRLTQRFLDGSQTSGMLIRALSLFPSLTELVIKRTHGQVFRA